MNPHGNVELYGLGIVVVAPDDLDELLAADGRAALADLELREKLWVQGQTSSRQDNKTCNGSLQSQGRGGGNRGKQVHRQMMGERGEGGAKKSCWGVWGGNYLGHVASGEAALVGDLGVGGALVEDRELDEAVVGLNMARAHGAADVLGEAAVEGHLATLETRAVRGRMD